MDVMMDPEGGTKYQSQQIFKEILGKNCSQSEIEVCLEAPIKVNRYLVDGSLANETFAEILQEKGGF